ncbi:MAG: sugar ABC transporter substrate-binding protein, partial [Chloroflexota bacterium]|nr:sugar ABC transporter substrate-binding protein [Chloroflexota bacterium]
ARATLVGARRGRAQGGQRVRALMWQNSPTINENFDKRVQMFNQAHAGEIEVALEFLPYDEYWQKLQLAYSAGDPYDIYFWDVQAYGHYKRDQLLNLQPLADAAGLYDPAQYPTELFQPWKLDGQNFFALPENFQTSAFYYNKTLFDQAGIPVPDDTWTWQRVVEVARELTVRNGDRVSQWGLHLGNLALWWGLQTISWAQGDAFMDRAVEPTRFQFSNPANVEALRFVQGLIHTEKVAPAPTENEQEADAIGFGSGRTAMQLEGSWAIAERRELPFEWGLAPLPKWGETRVPPYWIGGWVIAKESEVPEAAFEFARWSATDYQPTMATDHDWIPIRTPDRESEAMLDGMPAGFPGVTQALLGARLGDFYSANNQQIWVEVFDPNFERLLTNNQTPEETAKNIDEGANALL